MGCGIKAYYEDLEVEQEQRRYNKFASVDPKRVFYRLEQLEKDVDKLYALDLRLTKAEWSYLNSIKKHIKDILG